MTAPLPPSETQESFEWEYAHAAISATTTWKVRKPRRAYVIDAVQYINVTGLAADTTNAFQVAVAVGANTICNLVDTDSDTGAALAPNTWVDGTILPGTTLDYPQGAIDEELTVVATKNGTQTLPAGLFVFKGRYLSGNRG